MDAREVHDLVRHNRVIKSPRYHAGKRGLRFLEVLAALERCYKVAKDDRLPHADGWFALANLPNKRRLRIDFDAMEDDDGNLLLVVTAYDT